MKLKKISANLPVDLLKEACELSKMNQTECLVYALEEVISVFKRDKFLALKGTQSFCDIKNVRGRFRL